MADYQKMYAVLCKAIDEVIDPLERIPLALPWTACLRRALLEAEDIYVADKQPNTETNTVEG